MKKSTYHYHVKRFTKSDKYAAIKEKIQLLFSQSKGLYGYRRICLALRKEGIHLNHKTVRRLMSELQLKGLRKQRKYRSYRGEVGHIAENKVNQVFEAEKPNQIWLTDVSEFKVNGNKLYISAFLDVFNREIVGYEITSNPNFNLIEKSFKKASKHLKKTVESQHVVHSDQGWLYQIPRFQQLLSPLNMIQSMSRKGNCYDNALMESFFGLLKNECIYREKFKSIEHAKRVISKYIRFYNHYRIKGKLNGMSPIEFKLHYQKTS